MQTLMKDNNMTRWNTILYRPSFMESYKKKNWEGVGDGWCLECFSM